MRMPYADLHWVPRSQWRRERYVPTKQGADTLSRRKLRCRGGVACEHCEDQTWRNELFTAQPVLICLAAANGVCHPCGIVHGSDRCDF